MKNDIIQVLLVEDNPTDALLVQDELTHTQGAKFEVVHIEQLKEAIVQLKKERFDVVLLDLSLPDSHGFETFTRLHNVAAETPIVVLSGRADEAMAIKAVQSGAQDYLVKGNMNEDVLQRSIRYAIERRRAEQTLAESEERYRLLIEQSPDGYLVHCDGVIVFANTACRKLYGADRLDQVVGIPYLNFVAPSHHNLIRDRVKNALDQHSNPLIEVTGLRLDGATVEMECTGTPFQHEGRPAVQVVLHDITERKRSEERFRWLVESNVQGVMFWKGNGIITGANDKFLHLIGYTHAEMAAELIDWKCITPPEYTERDHRALQEIISTGSCAPYEKEFKRKNGSRVPVLLGAAILPGLETKEGVCFVLDITDLKKMEQQLLRSQRMESIGTLAGGIAHDLNNILSPIMMSAPLLRYDLGEEKREEIINTIEMSAARGAQIVKQVLTFGRGLEGDRCALHVDALVVELSQLMQETFPKNITLETMVDTDLWPVLGDATQLHQILLNLCVNARDAMPLGGRLRISATNLELDASYAGMLFEGKPGPHVLLEVSDSGSGIPPEILERIFDPFFTTKGIGQGTGLGLSTVLGIVKSHGGFLNVTSHPGKGTSFQVYLPGAIGHKVLVSDAEMATPLRGNGEWILVVDDEPVIVDTARRVLESHGYGVLEALDGIEAVAIFAQNIDRVALVLTDLMMPVLDGVALIRALRKIQPRLRIIASTGLGEKPHLAEMESLDVQAFLNKPYRSDTLLRTLHETLLPDEI